MEFASELIVSRSATRHAADTAPLDDLRPPEARRDRLIETADFGERRVGGDALASSPGEGALRGAGGGDDSSKAAVWAAIDPRGQDPVSAPRRAPFERTRGRPYCSCGAPVRSLRISGSGCEEALSSGSSSECEDTHTHAQQEFPIEILPNLYLGNSTNSEDCDALARHNIKYVLNVTPDLPNTFEAEGCGINYLKIPIADHWSQNLAVHFPQAIRFIEEAMSARCGVLVHCVAGVSRSVTVTLAYLMQRHRLCLRDAFELVRSRKTDIAPNFHFMRQLHSFERDLGLHEHSASLSKNQSIGARELPEKMAS
ncbi:unnamed protein product, partial [Iphiclides podalirius]